MCLNSGKKVRLSITIRGYCHLVLMGIYLFIDLLGLQILLNCGVNMSCVKSDSCNVGVDMIPYELCSAFE